MTLSKSDALNSAIEHHIRIYELMRTRGMTRSSATVVVDASMYGKGCLEGQVRAKVQAEIDKRDDSCPLCGKPLLYCCVGEYCSSDECRYAY